MLLEIAILPNPAHFWVYSYTIMGIPVHCGGNPGQPVTRVIWNLNSRDCGEDFILNFY